MTRTELIAEFREHAFDKSEPYLWGDDWLFVTLRAAEDEACIRGRLIHDSDTDEVCRVTISENTSSYALHPALYEITHSSVSYQGSRTPIRLVSTEWLDCNVTDWRTASGRPEYAIQQQGSIRLVPSPADDGELILEGFRLPLEYAADAADASPEFPAAHHRKLVEWLLYMAYSIPDTERLDPGKSQRAYADFQLYFGPRPDADLRASTRNDVPQHNVGYY